MTSIALAPLACIRWVRRLWQLSSVAVLLMLGAFALNAPAQAAEDFPFKTEELDQMLAPVALYPDSLLTQILMACTYPADVKEAADWSKAHPDLKGDAAVAKVQDKDWEPAVQSLVAFPQVMAMLREAPRDVQRLGDAFLADPGLVMDRVQVLRKQAQAAGNLKTNDKQKVTVQTEASNVQVIVIEPAQPQTVYVPVYQPATVYGVWGYPAYPPVYWPPPPYYYPPSSGAFVAGFFWGVAIVGINNSLWGGWNYGRGQVNINVNHYNQINVNRPITVNNNNFVHNSNRRGEVPYRDNRSREQYGKQQLPGAKDREDFRGKDGRDADRARANEALKSRGIEPVAGRDGMPVGSRDAVNAPRDMNRDRASTMQGTADRMDAGSRPAATDMQRPVSRPEPSIDRPTGRPAPSGALSGVGNASASRAQADRGRASRESMGQRSGGGGAAAGKARAR